MSGIKPQQQTFDKSLVRQSFGSASSSYNQFTALQRTIGDQLLQQQENLPSNQGKVLDIGAGTGYLTEKIIGSNKLDELYALDIAPEMLRQTRLNVTAVKPLTLLCADAEDLPLAAETVTAVYSNVAYQWCSRLPQAFAEARRVLRGEGVFAFSTFGERTLYELKDAWAEADNVVHVNSFFDADSIRQYLMAAGFKDVSVLSEDIVMYYETPKQLMMDLKGMGAHNINPGRNHGLTGVSAFKKMLAGYEGLRTEQGIPATFQALYGYARK
ncbi:malonyl-[acyl-carrier protein] O-methyltransferase BioC [Cycloclasticus sp. 46_83_sub15_T18]|nr:malonyl-[acyl-carrier protein] O-methyltransferase BioC [Cycloclasticus sp. 46_83_sub15_T18]